MNRITGKDAKLQKNGQRIPGRRPTLFVSPPLKNHHDILQEARKKAVQELKDKATIPHGSQQFMEENRSRRASDTAHHSRPLILLVDDSPIELFRVARHLRELGYRLMTSSHGIDALGQIEKTKPDLILADAEMPQMDGFQLTRLVKGNAKNREIPIIIMTQQFQIHIKTGSEEGVNGFLLKPYLVEDLHQQIEHLLS